MRPQLSDLAAFLRGPARKHVFRGIRIVPIEPRRLA